MNKKTKHLGRIQPSASAPPPVTLVSSEKRHDIDSPPPQPPLPPPQRITLSDVVEARRQWGLITQNPTATKADVKVFYDRYTALTAQYQAQLDAEKGDRTDG